MRDLVGSGCRAELAGAGDAQRMADKQLTRRDLGMVGRSPREHAQQGGWMQLLCALVAGRGTPD